MSESEPWIDDSWFLIPQLQSMMKTYLIIIQVLQSFCQDQDTIVIIGRVGHGVTFYQCNDNTCEIWNWMLGNGDMKV